MVSTLIKRLVSAHLLDDGEKAAIDLEVVIAEGAGYTIPIDPVIAVVQEVRSGRLPQNAMFQWITVAEMVDAQFIFDLLDSGTWDLFSLKLLFVMGERSLYTHQQIETILGLT